MVVFRGWQGDVLVGTASPTAVGKAENVEIRAAEGLTAYNEIGKRQPTDLVEGNEEITGTIKIAWMDANLTNLALGGESGLTAFHLYLRAGKATSGAPYIYLFNCKTENATFTVPQNDFSMHDQDFRALTYVYGTAA